MLFSLSVIGRIWGREVPAFKYRPTFNFEKQNWES